ncbi:YcnI family copper-binding membrane protein [Streptomyces abyssomicinicus]|uniref:YcnI family copper-binding membrane protein n=1 Tax=Streptomyces abyssomicinicus TaxID=574929 RepID=UPI00124FAA16|nr:YcnI family protein [Streptomyces abyssomicinicus]
MRTAIRCGILSLPALAALALAAPAQAHVSVQPEGAAAKGGYATVNVKVPNERDNASTVKVELSLPTDHPLSSVMPQPVQGWDIEVTRSKLDKPLTVHGRSIDEAVAKVTWTATGKGIEPGFFQKFPLSLGQLPEDADTLVLKSVQTYSNKEVVRWIEEPAEGQEEPEHPAPVLRLTAAAEDTHGSSAASAAPDEAVAAEEAAGDGEATASAQAASPSDGTARWLGAGGLVLGVAGLLTAVVSGRRRTGA